MSNNTINYPGDVTTFDPARILGPDIYGAYYRQVSATYDAGTDRTAMLLRPIASAELAQIVEDDKQQTFAKLDAIQSITELFGGAL